MVACPTLYPGQTVRARLMADGHNSTSVGVCLYVWAYGANDALEAFRGPQVTLGPGTDGELEWPVAVPIGCPIAWIGIELTSTTRADGTVYLDWLTWSGAPDVSFARPGHNGTRWQSAWVQACDAVIHNRGDTYRLVQNDGIGLLIQGTREWRDYCVSARLRPHLARSFGIAARVQGLRRYYALKLLAGGTAQLVRELDGTHVLAEAPLDWELYQYRTLELTVAGNRLIARADGSSLFDVEDASGLTGGAMALFVQEGRVAAEDVAVRPV
jgi:hypothetical protein